MAITTYAELQAAMAAWLVRGDLTARIPEYIALAESKLNRELRLRQTEVDAALTGVVGARTIALPAAYTEGLTCWVLPPGANQRQELRFVDPAHITVTTISGLPLAWTIDGATLAFERPCDQAYAFTLRCLEKLALSDTAPTNSLLTNYPDAYLFGALAEAGPMLRDQDLLTMYEGKLDAAIQSINSKEARSRAQQNLPTEPGQLLRAGRRSGFDIRRGF